ncbi:MAG: hypothetical protein R2856_14630 [Caldilineaceae bacterium]
MSPSFLHANLHLSPANPTKGHTRSHPNRPPNEESLIPLARAVGGALAIPRTGGGAGRKLYWRPCGPSDHGDCREFGVVRR